MNKPFRAKEHALKDECQSQYKAWGAANRGRTVRPADIWDAAWSCQQGMIDKQAREIRLLRVYVDNDSAAIVDECLAELEKEQ